MEWAAIQDWLCTPSVISKTGLSIQKHQKKTIENYCRLVTLKPKIKWLPVIQGWTFNNYISHINMYKAVGIDLSNLPIVGIGSLANRQDSPIVTKIIMELVSRNFKLHAFGLSITGLKDNHQSLVSSDSMVWSFIARKRKIKLANCDYEHVICNNCLQFAKKWRKDVLRSLRSMPNVR